MIGKITMSIDWTHFTPYSALAGGVLIGLAVSILLLLNGKIAGISGIVGGLLQPHSGDIGWRVAFVVGLVGAPVLYGLATALPESQIAASNAVLIIAGLTVGIGTRYGAGCTSGHGICGISRLSPRSILATVTFMLAGFITVFLLRHILQG